MKWKLTVVWVFLFTAYVKKTSEIGSVLFLYVLVKGVTVLPKDFQAKTVVRKKIAHCAKRNGHPRVNA